jgi:AraC-like DNA-binding protein
MAKTGPKGPSKPMSDKEFEQLVAMIRIQCTRDEICDVLNMSETTLNRRLKERGEHNFEALYKKHSGEGKASLRRMQWKAAEAGNPTMLVWLGKNMLDQKDKVEQDHTSSDGSMTPKAAVELTDEQLLRIASGDVK